MKTQSEVFLGKLALKEQAQKHLTARNRGAFHQVMFDTALFHEESLEKDMDDDEKLERVMAEISRVCRHELGLNHYSTDLIYNHVQKRLVLHKYQQSTI